MTTRVMLSRVKGKTADVVRVALHHLMTNLQFTVLHPHATGWVTTTDLYVVLNLQVFVDITLIM